LAPPRDLAVYLARCDATGRRLWGVSLCVPIVLVDPASGRHWASQAEPGPLPAIRANTAFQWQEQTWVMVLAPLPADKAQLLALLFHEAWHSRQAALGFPANAGAASHLDGVEGRYLMQLEWRALAAALNARGAERRAHLAQALAFRARRLGRIPGAREAERQLMRHEGLAAYTGTALSGDPRRVALAALAAGPHAPSLTRSFAYASAPAWGVLLDALRPGWNRHVPADADLPDLIPVPAATIARPDDYGGAALLADEARAGMEREARLAASLAATSEARGLFLPLAQAQMNFDPNRVSPAPDGSTIYHRITLSDAWGRIAVEGIGLRIGADFHGAWAPWPLPPGALELRPGWRVAERPGGGARLVPPGS
jgi:hypothetical protein